MEYVKGRDIFGSGPSKEIPCLTDKGAPTTATAGAVGCLYMDEDTGNLYKCTAAADGVYAWAKVEAASFYYIPKVTDNGNGTVTFAWTPSVTGYPIPKPTVVELPSGSSDSGENADGSISTNARNLLIAILRNGRYISDQSENITALDAALASGGNDSEGDSGGEDSEGGTVGGTELVLSDLEWTAGKTLTGADAFIDHGGKSVSAAVDVSGVTSVKVVVAKTQTAFASAPMLAKVLDTESVAGHTLIKNVEGANYIGASYAYELTFDVSDADYIRFVCDTTSIVNLTATLETEVS